LFIPELRGQLKLGYMAETKGREGGLNQPIGFSQKAYERLQANWDGIAKDL
jgi:hypothetical protein